MFGRGRRGRSSDGAEQEVDGFAAAPETPAAPETGIGPYDLSELPESDDVERLDLGSVRLPVPEGSQLQVEVDPAG